MQEYFKSNPIDLSWNAYGDRYVDNIKNALK